MIDGTNDCKMFSDCPNPRASVQNPPQRISYRPTGYVRSDCECVNQYNYDCSTDSICSDGSILTKFNAYTKTNEIEFSLKQVSDPNGNSINFDISYGLSTTDPDY